VTALVTGAAGLLGSHVVDLLLEGGERPRVLVRPGDSLNGPGERVDVRWGDITDPNAVESAVDNVDRVFHCAARTGAWGPEADYERTNVGGLKALLEAALAAGVGRVVHVSSITVHGNDLGGEADETAPFRSESNPYSRSKIEGERVVQSFVRERGAPVVTVRPGWIYGPRDAASFGRLAKAIEQGRMFVIGSGRNHLPLVHVRDAARGLLLAASADDADGEAFLLVSDERVTQSEYLEAIAAELGAAPPRRRIPYRLALAVGAAAEAAVKVSGGKRPPPLSRYGFQLLGGENRFDIGKARDVLGFEPQVDLADGVRESVAWYRQSSPDSEAA
jgi:nucleoside-diphosphate-sugar epimerase